MRVELRQDEIVIGHDVQKEPAADLIIMIATSLVSAKSHEEFISLSKIQETSPPDTVVSY